MTQLTAAIIGCGDRGHEHAKGYAASPDVQIVAAVDPKPEARRSMREKFGVPNLYPDHPALFAAHKPDILSVCTWPGLHAQQVIDAARAGGVRAIHCEKPMAPTWGESQRMHRACQEAGVQLTFCHQRRFGAHFEKARELAQEGAIGEITRLEGYCSNLFDWGTHWFDMFFFYNGETPAEWVLGQIDTSSVRRVFGVPVETSGLAHVRFANGVHGLLFTGPDQDATCSNRIVGTKGIIEVEVRNGPPVRLRRDAAAGWEEPALPRKAHGDTILSILDAIDCVQTGRKPRLGSENAIRATELIFATYESARRRGRVALPLEIEDSPLLSLLNMDVVNA
ncbi:MAG TPA: Gfo/Idh/MocA family oxidoreductase [Chthonomonadaceae bacterium]|nr:Gfo/Idh/MocA family oxidoreductase [Chthonomonadaceae bacterium]